MASYLTFDHIQQGGTEEEALEVARGMVWQEIEASEQNIGYADHIDTIDGVGVYYDYAADYYFFTDESEV